MSTDHQFQESARSTLFTNTNLPGDIPRSSIRFVDGQVHFKQGRHASQQRIGRFIRKYWGGFGDVTDERVKDLVARIQGELTEEAIQMGGAEFGMTSDPDLCRTIYRQGPSSCMSGSYSLYVGGEPVHPTDAYWHEDNGLALAYLKTEEHGYLARTLVNTDARVYSLVYDKWDVVYGSATHLRRWLEQQGYEQDEDGVLGGVHLRRIVTDCGRILCPYLDGYHDGAEDCGDYLLPVDGGGQEPDHTTGTLAPEDAWCCPECGNYVDDDQRTEIVDADPVCLNCAEGGYTQAYCLYRGEGVWVSHLYVESVDGEYLHVADGDNDEREYREVTAGPSGGQWAPTGDVLSCPNDEYHYWRGDVSDTDSDILLYRGDVYAVDEGWELLDGEPVHEDDVPADAEHIAEGDDGYRLGWHYFRQHRTSDPDAPKQEDLDLW